MQLRQSMKEIVERPFFVLLSLLVFLTPLVMSNSTNELFEFPKMFFVYFSVIGILALHLTFLVLNREKPVWPSLVALMFLLACIISTVFSSHLYTSFWGYYTRFNGGLLSVLLFLAFYFVCKNRLKTADYFELMKMVAITVFPIGIIGIMQHYGWGTGIVERVYSTFGQPNWLAQFLVMLIPFILYLCLTENFFFWAAAFLVGYSALWFTYSTSGMISFVVATLAFVAISFSKKLLSKTMLFRIAGIYLVCFLVSITNLGLFRGKIMDTLKDLRKASVTLETTKPAETSASVENVTPPEIQDNNYQVSDPGFIRLGLWKGSWNLFLSSPKIFLIGTGLETFPYAFQPFRLGSLNYTSEWDYVFNKPHNYYLELLDEMGIVGFVVYVILLIKLVRKLPFYILPGLLGFITANLFGWSVVSTALLFWLWLSWSEAS